MVLPPGLQVRPLTMDDAIPVAKLQRAGEVHDVGKALVDDEDIIGDWRRRSFNLETQPLRTLIDDSRSCKAPNPLPSPGPCGHTEVFRARRHPTDRDDRRLTHDDSG